MNTRFILPPWWVKAYEAAALSEAGEDSAMTQAMTAGLSPALTVTELNALAVIISSVQEQLLAGAPTLSIDPEEHGKHISTSVKARRFAFEKVTQLLGSLTILSEQPTERSVLSFKPIVGASWRRRSIAPRVESEQNHSGSHTSEWLIELTLADRGSELIFGLSDSYRDALAKARGEPSLELASHARTPLTLWRSIWHELQGPEQLVLMRLERAMQWGFNWLTLEGTFGTPLNDLLQGLKLSEGKIAESELVRQLKLLAKLGKKLTEHGFLSPAPSEQFLAFGENGQITNGLSLVWQMSRERLMADAMPEFRQNVAQHFLGNYKATAGIEGSFSDVFQIANGRPAGASQTLFWRDHWHKLADLGASSAVTEMMLPSQVHLPQLLYLEWSLRLEPGAGLPLPESLRSSELAQAVSTGYGMQASREPIESSFQKFLAILAGDSEWGRVLREEPWACIASPATLSDGQFITYSRQVFAATRPGSTSYAAAGHSFSRKEGVIPADDLSGDSAPLRAKAALSGALAARMRRTASDELQKMRSQFPSKYKDLQRSYLESLDEPGRKLLLDVQKRMQSSLFEEHLRQRLVRFMIENPGSWRSVDQSGVSGATGRPGPAGKTSDRSL